MGLFSSKQNEEDVDQKLQEIRNSNSEAIHLSNEIVMNELKTYIDEKIKDVCKKTNTLKESVKGALPLLEDEMKVYVSEYVEKRVNEMMEEECKKHRARLEEKRIAEEKEKAKKQEEILAVMRKKQELLLLKKNEDQISPASMISDEALENFIQKLIDDPNTNIYGFPDSMEKSLYMKVLKSTLHSIGHMSDDASIIIFGHCVRIYIYPLTGSTPEDVPISEISDKALEIYVQNLIADPTVNIYGFPDVLEKAIYMKLLKTILHAVAHISDDSAILLFGHVIRLYLYPLNE